MGAPCTGKSTLASYIFYCLKKNNFNIELTSEYIKSWVYQKHFPKGFEGLYILSKQVYAEETYLQNGADLIVTDSPLLLNYYYANYSI